MEDLDRSVEYACRRSAKNQRLTNQLYGKVSPRHGAPASLSIVNMLQLDLITFSFSPRKKDGNVRAISNESATCSATQSGSLESIRS